MNNLNISELMPNHNHSEIMPNLNLSELMPNLNPNPNPNLKNVASYLALIPKVACSNPAIESYFRIFLFAYP